MLPMIASRYMRPLYRVADIRRREQASFHKEGESFAMMMRAGQSLWRHIQQQTPKLQSLAIVAGGGNNGGDGLVVAYLAAQEGVLVHLYDVSTQPRQGDAGRAEALLDGLTDIVRKDAASLPQEASAVLLDALLGIGFRAPLSQDYQSLINSINHLRDETGVRVVSVDCPSGLDVDTGAAALAVQADCVVSFIADKMGHYLREGAVYSSTVVVDALQAVDVSDAAQAYALDLAFMDAFQPCARSAFSHKGSYGHVTVLGGDLGFGGAAIMASEAAAKAGAGTVSLVTQADHLSASLTRNPNVMCLAGDPQALASTMRGDEPVLVVGPGLGRSQWSQRLWHELFDVLPNSVVVDADGLYWLKQNVFHAPKMVITPHPGEAAMLLDKSIDAVLLDLPGAALALAKNFQAVAVLKGATTVVASPEGKVMIVGRPCPSLAKGGAGDVLSGIIGACLAYYSDAFSAAVLGVAWHNQSAQRCAQRTGAVSMQPYQLLDYLD